jgi:hypothetical protein
MRTMVFVREQVRAEGEERHATANGTPITRVRDNFEDLGPVNGIEHEWTAREQASANLCGMGDPAPGPATGITVNSHLGHDKRMRPRERGVGL